MTTRRLVATTNVAASSADSEVNPYAAGFQALLATARARFYPADCREMRALFTHDQNIYGTAVLFHQRASMSGLRLVLYLE
jgi:hypothetical protein